LGIDVPSGVRHTPLNRQDTMAGARHRADALATIALEKREPWNYFLGLEGGLDVVWSQGTRSVFLQNWAYVTEGSGRGAFGQSGSILLPEPLAQRVVEEGVELSEAIDAFAGRRGIRDSTGAWGILSGGLISRKDAFCVAVINAFAPFINREIYGLTRAKA
jgi:non-canonical (house-cleaning) NTP pyrophosphatase